ALPRSSGRATRKWAPRSAPAATPPSLPSCSPGFHGRRRDVNGSRIPSGRGARASRRQREAARRGGGSGSSPRREPMRVAIIDYGSGNLHSAAKAFERAAREQGSDLAVKVTARPEDVADADRIVLPGVGAFADCKRGLEELPGMIDALEEAVQG